MKQKTQRQNQPTLKQTAFLCCVFAAFLIAPIITPTAASAQDITSGLVAHWEFNDTSGSTVTDSSGNGNNGTWSDGANDDLAEESITSSTGNALRLSANSNVTAPIFPTGASAPYSVAIWIKFNGLGASGQNKVWGAGPYPATCQDGPSLSKNFESGNYFLRSDNQCVGKVRTNSYQVEDVWYHVVTTYDGTNISLYLNGQLQNSISSNYKGTDPQAADFILGSYDGSSILADIDDVRIYNRAISVEDIQTLRSRLEACEGEADAGKMIYNEDYRAMQYCDGSIWQSMGKGASILHGQKTEGQDYDINAVNFDGTNDYLEVTGLSKPPPSLVTGSFWVRRDTGNLGTTQTILRYRNPAGEYLRLRFNTSNQFSIDGQEDGVGIFNILARTVNPISDSNWHHIAFSIDTTNRSLDQIYVDGVLDVTSSGNTYIAIGGGSEASIGSFGTIEKLYGYLADIWVDFGTKIDFSIAANQRLFTDIDGKAVNLGTDGSLPTGSPPDIFLSGDTADWHTNKGTGGGFTESGELTTATTLPPAQSAKKMLGWWRLDETSGTTFKDSSGNGNDATSSNITMPAASSIAPVGNGIDLSENGQSRIETSAVSTFTQGNAFTYAAWMKPTIIDGVMGIIRIEGVLDLQTKFNSNEIQLSPKLWDTNGAFTSTTRFNVGEWTHVAITFDYDNPINTQPKMYLNGVAVPVITNTNSSGPFLGMPTTSKVFIGFRGTSNGNFHGIIDDARFYNYELSPDEIAEIYAASNTFGGPYGTYIDSAANNYLSGPISTASDSKQLTLSFWYQQDASDGGPMTILQTDNGTEGGIDISINGGGSQALSIGASNTAQTDILGLTGSGGILRDGEWHHVLISVDLSDPTKRHLYVDGVDDLSNVNNYVDDIMDLTPQNLDYYIGRNESGGRDIKGSLYKLWFDTGTYIDFSNPTNRALFDIDADLGTNGEIPTGSAPDIFLTNDAPTWNVNSGTGGNFTLTGTLTNSPTKLPGNEKQPRYCANPSQPEGTLIFNTDDNVMQYCDGYQYIPLGPPGDGGGSCSNPSGSAGFLYYNTDFRTIEYCEGDEWIGVGRDGTSLALSNGLLGHWTFDESSGNFADIINGNDAVPQGDYAYDPNGGVIGGAVELGGTNSCLVAGSNSINLQTAGTYSFWVNYRDDQDSDGFITNAAIFIINRSGGNTRFQMDDSGGGSFPYNLDITAQQVDLNQWTHMILTYDSNGAKVYKNGALITTSGAPALTPDYAQPSNFYFGCDRNIPNRHLEGKIDDVRIYNRALSAAEAQALYNRANIDPCSKNSVTPGTTCNDGTIYAGSRNYGSGNEKLFVPAEFRQSGGIRWKVSVLADAIHISTESSDDGKINTANLNASIDNFPAFNLCDSLDRHGYKDWYLPARNELQMLKSNSLADAATYWTSNESNEFNATANSGAFFTVDKDSSLPDVRCVRRN